LSVVTFILVAVPAIDPRERVERFVLRARRMMAHSLVREQSKLLEDLASSTMQLHIEVNTETGETAQRFRMELPPEETFESFAARVRPFTMRKEPVYWAVVLDALVTLVSPQTLAEIIDVDDLRNHWSTVAEGKKMAQAFYVMTEKGQLSDVELADLWLNSDALHTQLIQSEVGKELSLDQRYRAAAGVYARIGACVNATYIVIAYLVREGLLELDPEVLTVAVLAKTSVDFPAKAYRAELRAELPTDLSNLDPSIWRPIQEDIEFLGGAETDGSPGDPKA
jgi:hypothetical protein